MRQLHIRAQSGPRPVTVAAVHALLDARQIDPTGAVLSLDGGRTWQSVDSALAVIDGLAVQDGAIDVALRTGPLHPIAMPLGVLAVAMLACAIGFSGSLAAPTIRATPALVGGVAAEVAGVAAETAGKAVFAGVRGVTGVVSGFLTAGCGRPATPAATTATPTAALVATPVATPAATAPAASGDLLADWRQLLADSDRPAAQWTAAADALGKRTVAEGLKGWNVRLSNLDVISDANRAALTAGQTGGDKALRLAYLDVHGITLLLLVSDPALAGICDKLAAEKRDPCISARITGVMHAAADRAVVFNGTLTAVE